MILTNTLSSHALPRALPTHEFPDRARLTVLLTVCFCFPYSCIYLFTHTYAYLVLLVYQTHDLLSLQVV